MRSKVLQIMVMTGAVAAGVCIAAFLATGTIRTGAAVRDVYKAVYTTPEFVSVSGSLPGQDTREAELIRFHVIANSDSERDQALKRKVRDLIVERMTPEFAAARNLQEARKIAAEHLDEIKSIAEKEVAAWGEKYPVSARLGRFDFPVKTYGELTLPAGNYEAVKVVIGRGQGANWWCVLFPPLCFVDVSRALTPPETETAAAAVYKRYGKSINTVKTGEYTSRSLEKEPETYRIRFKLLELLGF